MNEKTRVARNIKVIREIRNYTQDYVAGQLGIARSTYSNWEHGNVELKPAALSELAAVFGLPSYKKIIELNPDILLN